MTAAATPEKPASQIENSLIVDSVSTKTLGSLAMGMIALLRKSVREAYDAGLGRCRID
jgi:hypothetical protein